MSSDTATVIKPRDAAAAAARSVLIINTGGTIGMMRGADGALVPSPCSTPMR